MLILACPCTFLPMAAEKYQKNATQGRDPRSLPSASIPLLCARYSASRNAYALSGRGLTDNRDVGGAPTISLCPAALRDGAWSDGGTPVAQNRPKPHPA